MNIENIEKRIETERRIVSRIVKDAIKAGYSMSVYDGEEWVLKSCNEYQKTMRALFSTDEDTILFKTNDNRTVGRVYLVYGNDDGFDVICDYTANEVTENLLKGAEQLAEDLQLYIG
jgi:hypothetical protein